MWENSVITNSGKELIKKCLNGKLLTITRAAVGMGTASNALLMEQTGLKSQKKMAQIIEKKEIASGVKIRVQVTSLNTPQSYTINQIGIWGAVEGTEALIAIYQDESGVVVPSTTESGDFVFNFWATIQISGQGNIEVNVDTSAAVSLAKLEEELQERDLQIQNLNEYAIPKSFIVDNRTTNDATKVLSAAEGKRLGDDLAAHQTATQEAIDRQGRTILDLSIKKVDCDGGDIGFTQILFNDAPSTVLSFTDFLSKLTGNMKVFQFLRDFKAGMKYVLDQGKLVNNCVSTSTTLPLAASQGKVLQDQITTLNSKLNVKEISGVVESSSFYVFYTMEELTLGTVKIPRYARGIYIGYETNAAILAIDYNGKFYHAYRSSGVWKST